MRRVTAGLSKDFRVPWVVGLCHLKLSGGHYFTLSVGRFGVYFCYCGQ